MGNCSDTILCKSTNAKISYGLGSRMNGSDFIAPARQAQAEIVIKKSKFIGHVTPAFSAKEAEAFIESVRERHNSATHNVYAYVIGLGIPTEKASDDGEPRGTAGYPVLEVIKKRNLCNVVVVVTRYFGGILLGTGGLIRAYGRAASMALDQAGTAHYVYHKLLVVTLDYDQFGKVQREIENLGSTISDVVYDLKVTVKTYVQTDTANNLINRIRNITADKATITFKGGKYIPCS